MKAIFGVSLIISTGLIAPALAQGDVSAENFAQVCIAQTNLPGSACTCLGETAVKQLAPAVQPYTLALIAGELAVADTLASALSLEDKAAAGFFLASTPGLCAG